MIELIRGARVNGTAVVTIDGDKVLGLPPLHPRHEARHSPSGFEWGYAGSGPAELARALLLAVFQDQEAERVIVRHPGCYQRFKAAVIQYLPRAGFTMSARAVEGWYRAWEATEAGQAVVAKATQCVACGGPADLKVENLGFGGLCRDCSKVFDQPA